MILYSEIGSDMSRWPTEKHFCSWLGLCPHHRITGGKLLSSRIRPGPNRAAEALRLAARSLHASKGALGAYFRRLKSRLGTAQAIVATAHKLARLVYSMLKHGTAYVQQGLGAYERPYRQRSAAALARRARASWATSWSPRRTSVNPGAEENPRPGGDAHDEGPRRSTPRGVMWGGGSCRWRPPPVQARPIPATRTYDESSLGVSTPKQLTPVDHTEVGHVGVDDTRVFQRWADVPRARRQRGCERASVPVRVFGPRAFSAVKDHVSPCWYQGRSPRGRIRRG